MLLIIIGSILLITLVVLHELGHFYAARRAGVEVEEFGIGFPPKAKTLGKRNGTEYTLNWLPLGGFVKLKGENDSNTAKGSYGAAKLSDKVKIMLAGVVVNLLTAIFILTIIAAIGLPKVLDNQFTVSGDTKISKQQVIAGDVAENSPAQSAGIENGDRVISLQELDCNDNCTTAILTKADELGQATQSLAGKKVLVTYEKLGGDFESAETTLQTPEEVENSRSVRADCIEQNQSDCPAVKGFLGVVPSEYIEYRSTWSAPIVATVFSGQVVQETFRSFGQIFSDIFKGDSTTVKESVTGVVGIGYLLGQLSAQGLMSVLFLVAIISLSLAIMNFLPIPALDGGRLFVTLIFRLFKKPLTKQTEERIHGTGFAMLMMLFLAITVLDVQRFII